MNAGERFDGSSQGFVRADVGFYDDFGDDYDESKVRGTGKKGRDEQRHHTTGGVT